MPFALAQLDHAARLVSECVEERPAEKHTPMLRVVGEHDKAQHPPQDSMEVCSAAAFMSLLLQRHLYLHGYVPIWQRTDCTNLFIDHSTSTYYAFFITTGTR
jgi:hypothetical protein